MALEPLPLDRIRIGDRERDAVVAVLQKAGEDGRLSMADLDERLEVALHAYSPSKPLLVIHGSLGMGSLEVRPPNRFDKRRTS